MTPSPVDQTALNAEPLKQLPIAIEHYRHPDLRAAMLRASFRRAPIRWLYLPPASAAMLALLTAGLLPTGLLLWRLWLYASFQRFRAGELAKWLAMREGFAGEPYRRMVQIIRPTTTIIITAIAYFTACIGAAAMVWHFGRWLTGGEWFLPNRPLYSPRLMAFIGGSIAASMGLILSILIVRLNMWMLISKVSIRGPILNRNKQYFDLPMFVVWPIGLGVVAIALSALNLDSVGRWLMASSVSLLAAEVQRGYIIVADRRLRVAVARAMGPMMYPPGTSR